MAVVKEYPKGELPKTYQAGDILLVRNVKQGAITELIQAGERARYGDTDWARWSHAALISSGYGHLVEALSEGVRETKIEKYRDYDFTVISPPQVDAGARSRAVGQALRFVGDSYGILNFVGLAVQALFGFNISIHMDAQFICSGLVARCTEKYIVSYPHAPENMMPADLAHYWGAMSGEPVLPLHWFDRFLDKVRMIGRWLVRKS